MEAIKRYGWGRRLAWAGAAAGAGGLAVGLLAPDGTETRGTSAAVYRDLTGALADAPPWAELALEAASEGTVVFLGLLLAWVGWGALRRRDVRVLAAVAAVGAAVLVAYGLSETLKVLIEEERPCRAVPGADALASCPDPGDWSFPSNHSTLAVALAVGIASVRPRLAALALPVGAAAALLRVLVGVHYPHDVLAGALLATAVVVVVRILAQPVAEAVASALVRQPGRRRRDHAGLVGDHGRSGPVVDPQPRQDRADMGLHGAFGQPQPPGYLPVGQAPAEEAEHVPFPGGQGLHAGAGRGPASGAGARAAGGEVRDDPRRDLW